MDGDEDSECVGYFCDGPGCQVADDSNVGGHPIVGPRFRIIDTGALQEGGSLFGGGEGEGECDLCERCFSASLEVLTDEQRESYKYARYDEGEQTSEDEMEAVQEGVRAPCGLGGGTALDLTAEILQRPQ